MSFSIWSYWKRIVGGIVAIGIGTSGLAGFLGNVSSIGEVVQRVSIFFGAEPELKINRARVQTVTEKSEHVGREFIRMELTLANTFNRDMENCHAELYFTDNLDEAGAETSIGSVPKGSQLSHFDIILEAARMDYDTSASLRVVCDAVITKFALVSLFPLSPAIWPLPWPIPSAPSAPQDRRQ